MIHLLVMFKLNLDWNIKGKGRIIHKKWTKSNYEFFIDKTNKFPFTFVLYSSNLLYIIYKLQLTYKNLVKKIREKGRKIT